MQLIQKSILTFTELKKLNKIKNKKTIYELLKSCKWKHSYIINLQNKTFKIFCMETARNNVFYRTIF